jgi:mycothiol synthase
MALDSAGTGTDWERLEELVLDWSESPHQPSLSEFSRLKLREHKGVVLVNADQSAVVTMVPTGEQGHHLVEMAAPSGVAPGEIWDQARDSIVQMARGRGVRSISVLVAADLAAQLRGEGIEPARTVLRGSLTVAGFAPRRPDTAIGTFRRDVDEEELVRLLRLTITGQPASGAWDRADLEVRFAQPGFDERDLFLERPESHLVGFCWTKAHADGVGEIYLLGVDPAHRGRGVGRVLVERGVRHLLEDRACPEVIAFWDEENRAATNLYESIGFGVDRIDEVYRLEL